MLQEQKSFYNLMWQKCTLIGDFYLPHKALPLASREVFRQNGTKVAPERLLDVHGKQVDLAMTKVGL